MRVPFFAFRDFPAGILQQTEQAVLQALRGKHLILGPKVEEFEQQFARWVGVKHCIGVGNGYDALALSVRTAGIGKGDSVLLSANGYIAAANAVVAAGATPVFADPDPATGNLRTATAQKHLTASIKAILPVYLYGQVSEAAELEKLCQEKELILIEDFAQAQGAKQEGRMAGSFGLVNATSFYPTKNLGAAGDAGAVCTDNDAIAEQLKLLRNYGQRTRYRNELIGINTRLDELQAAVLLEKLAVADQLTQERRRLAEVYLHELKGIPKLMLPEAISPEAHTWHLFVIRTQQRDELQSYLAQSEISTLIHYPIPPYRQQAYTWLQLPPGTFPVTDELAATCLSLPLFPGLTAHEQEYAIAKVKAFFQSRN